MIADTWRQILNDRLHHPNGHHADHRWQDMYVTTAKKRSINAHFDMHNHMVNGKV